jgi:hypothetical protein
VKEERRNNEIAGGPFLPECLNGLIGVLAYARHQQARVRHVVTVSPINVDRSDVSGVFAPSLICFSSFRREGNGTAFLPVWFALPYRGQNEHPARGLVTSAACAGTLRGGLDDLLRFIQGLHLGKHRLQIRDVQPQPGIFQLDVVELGKQALEPPLRTLIPRTEPLSRGSTAALCKRSKIGGQRLRIGG